ncbi:MAG: pseudouridine synthase [Pseudomonadota bacterium]
MHVPPDPRPSYLQLAPGPWPTLLDGLCARFPAIDRATWRDRFARGRVQEALSGAPLGVHAPWRVGMEIRYYREVFDEAVIPFEERVLHADEHLVVADKPHFLPVVTAGRFVRETLLARLVARLGNPDLVPLHRIDRETAGLVLFSANPATRAAYQALFRERRIDKEYRALAPPMPQRAFPFVHASRIERGEPFFRMREVDGAANSQTRVDVIERGEAAWTYALSPVTGRKHQLRVHMAALGAPILGDSLYPTPIGTTGDPFTRPLQLLAWRLAFADPPTGTAREFLSRRCFGPADDDAPAGPDA